MAQLTLPLIQTAASPETLFSITNTFPPAPMAGPPTAAPTIVGASTCGVGVQGLTGDPMSGSAAVEGVNTGNGPGVFGSATANDAVLGRSSSGANAGVAGHNTSAGGVGVYGTGAVAGKFDGNVKVNGNLNVVAQAGQGQAITAVGNLNVVAQALQGQAITAVGNDQNSDCINATSTAAGHAGVSANNTGPGFGLWASSVLGVAVYGKSGGTYAGQFDGNVLVNGTLTVSTDIILSAADCAEEFDVAAYESAEPGTVMVVDEGGSLRRSDQSYDRKVAGVISGAGEFRAGMILDRRNCPEQRACLALVGKVYCKVDAKYGSIEVGDLLTTSSTPGHAMKAGDPQRAFGAVIGKALRPLRDGQGLVPILIALQ